MERRALLKGLAVGIPTTAAAVAGIAAKSAAYVRETSERSADTCKEQIDALRKHMEESEVSTKKMLKTVLALTALSLGMDVSALI